MGCFSYSLEPLITRGVINYFAMTGYLFFIKLYTYRVVYAELLQVKEGSICSVG